MFSKTNQLNNDENNNQDETIVIKPTKEMKEERNIVILLLLMIPLVFLWMSIEYKVKFIYGFYMVLFGVVVALVGINSQNAEFSKVVFSKNKIVSSYKNKDKVYSWEDLKTIRFERYYEGWQMNDVLYFSKKKTKKPKWLDPGLLFTPFNNSFYVELVDRRLYERDYLNFSYPKYEFLDKLKEWGVTVEIDEKYLKKDPKLRKYISNDNDYIEVEETEYKTPNEWIIDNHTIKCNEYNDNYYIVVDYKTIKVIDKKQVRRRGVEVPVILDNIKYLIVYNQGKFSIVKNRRYLDTNKLYISKKMDFVVAGINVLILLACLFMRMFNLFTNNIDMIILVLALMSGVIAGIYLIIKR